MYVCQLCDHFASRRLASVLSHIGAVHSHQSGFSVLCGIDSCPRTYRNYHSFRHHIKQKHPSACNDCDSHTESNVTDMQTIGGENGPEDLFGESFGDPLNQSTSKKRTTALFLLKLKEKYQLSQATVNEIVQDIDAMVGNIACDLRLRVTSALEEADVNLALVPDFADAFNAPTIVQPSAGLHTQHLQNKFYRQHLGLVSNCGNHAKKTD